MSYMIRALNCEWSRQFRVLALEEFSVNHYLRSCVTVRSACRMIRSFYLNFRDIEAYDFVIDKVTWFRLRVFAKVGYRLSNRAQRRNSDVRAVFAEVG